jgi:hypothetical protein
MDEKRKHVSMKNQVREELAQKHYLNPDSPGYLNEVKARTLAGYSESYAKSASGTLWEKADIESLKDILPADSKNVGDELRKWLELMAKWRNKLSKVDDPVKLGSRTFAVVASYIERLAKIFGLIIDRQERKELQVRVEEKRHILQFGSPEEEYRFKWEAIRTLSDELEQIDIPQERKRAIEAELGFEEKREKSEDNSE